MFRRSAPRRRLVLAAIGLGAAVALAACGSGPKATAEAPAPPEITCAKYASPEGSDSAPGTAEEPLRSPQQLVDELGEGEAGCLLAGLHDADDEVKVETRGVTLASAPGEPATLRTRLWVAGDEITVAGLDLDGRNDDEQTSPNITGDDARFVANDVTNEHTGICFSLGQTGFGRADRTTIEGNRIHDCGRLPRTNFDHGIYVAKATKTVIRSNWIYDNADRGVQLYPDAQDSEVSANVIVSNGEGVSIGGDRYDASSGNVVEGNVIAGSEERSNVEVRWPGEVGSGNEVRGNCLWGTNAEAFYNEGGGVIDDGTLSLADNVVAEPLFADREAGDLSLIGTTECVEAAPDVPADLLAGE